MDATRAIAEGEQAGGALLLKVSGIWRVTGELPGVTEVMRQHADCRQIRIAPEALVEWDTSLPLFLMQLRSWAREHGATLNLDALPVALKRLFDLVRESEEKAPPPRPPEAARSPASVFVRRAVEEAKGWAVFVGECVIAMIEIPANLGQVRWKSFFLEMVDAGPKALPVVGLLSFLVGVVFTYETTTQLRQFGAQVFAIDALGGAVVRQMGPILAAVIVAGRTGAAFAAHIGNMKLGGEIDALEVLGVSPINFLVLPRLGALFWMMPMLTLYADMFGVLGGLVVACVKVHVPATEFWVRLESTVSLTDVVVGLIKAVIFGVLIGLSGTLRGLQCERSSAGVGRAATAAVVMGIAATIAGNTLISPIIDKLGN